MTPTLNQIERACADLARDGQPITFASVAERTGTARSTLYRNQALRAVIEHHRRAAPEGTITAITDELATLRAAIQTLADTRPAPRRATPTPHPRLNALTGQTAPHARLAGSCLSG